MAFLRRWLLIWCTLVTSGGTLLAASRESLAYAAAVEDVRDKMWGQAEMKFDQFVRRYPKSTNAPMAILLEAQAQFQQGKFEDASALLTDTNRLAQAQVTGIADQYARWTGEAQFAGGQYEAAAATFADAAKNYPQSTAALGMVISAASAREKLGQWTTLDGLLEATNGVFQRALRLDPDNQQVADGRLLLVHSKFEQGNFPAALGILNQLNPHTLTSGQEGNRAQQLYQLMVAMENDEGALSATTNLMKLADPVLRSDGVAAHATLLEKAGRLKEAGAGWNDNLVVGAPLERQREAMLKIAALAMAQNSFTNAAAELDSFLGKFPDSVLSETALLTAGEMNLRNFVVTGATNLAALTPAKDRFDELLAKSTNSPLAGKAYLDRGWCEWFTGNYPESATDFRLAALKTLPPADFAVATFKLGDAQYAQGQYAVARDNYRQIPILFANEPDVMKSLEERILYQVLRTSLELHDRAGAETALSALLEKFPGGGDTAPGLLLAGEAFSDFSSPRAARDVLQHFEKQFPDSSLRPDAEFAVARTYENEQNWPMAVTHHEAWLKSFPGNALGPQVQFALGRANYQAGNEAAAFELFTNFVASFPTNALAPVAQWWVAEHYFRAGEWAGAETNYESVFQNTSPVWQTNVLVLPARLMAGRAAMGRQGYPDAVHYFNALIDLVGKTNGPQDLGVQARFFDGAALLNSDSTDTNNPLLNVQLATNILSQILTIDPTNEYGARAWGQIGNCDQLLGDFDAATNAYAQVLALDPTDVSVRGTARVGMGMALEKKAALASGNDQKNLLKLALDQYLTLLDPQETVDEYWMKKAGLQAASVAESLGDWTTARAIYGRLRRELPQLADMMDKKIQADDANQAATLKKN